jgi:hypothetical protein
MLMPSQFPHSKRFHHNLLPLTLFSTGSTPALSQYLPTRNFRTEEGWLKALRNPGEMNRFQGERDNSLSEGFRQHLPGKCRCQFET